MSILSRTRDLVFESHHYLGNKFAITQRSGWFQSNSLLGVFTVGTACAAEGLCCFRSSSLRSVLWTTQSFAVTVWTYATPELSPCSHQCAVVIGKAKQVVRFSPWCETEAPHFLCCFAKNESCRLSDTIECFETPLVFMAQTCVRAVVSCAPSIFVR